MDKEVTIEQAKLIHERLLKAIDKAEDREDADSDRRCINFYDNGIAGEVYVEYLKPEKDKTSGEVLHELRDVVAESLKAVAGHNGEEAAYEHVLSLIDEKLTKIG